MDYNKLNEERISSTKIYAYDQITAISQKAINKQLANMYKANKTLKKISATLADDDYAGLFADLDPPEIELQLGTDSTSIAFGHVCIDSNNFIPDGRSGGLLFHQAQGAVLDDSSYIG